MGEFKIFDRNDSNLLRSIDLGIDSSDYGKPDSLRYLVVNLVTNEKYEKAIEELKLFMNSESEYPQFKQKTERYIKHSIDLIYAIKAKKNFPGLNQLTRAKQQELRDRFKEHLRELVFVLKKVEQIERSMMIEDAKSTLLVIKAGVIAVFCILLLWFFIEIYKGLAFTSFLVIEDVITKSINFVFNFFNF